VFLRTSKLTSPIVLLRPTIDCPSVDVIMTSKELAINVLFLSMLISLDHICYSCSLNLNVGFFTMFGALLLQLVGTSYIMDNSLVIFQI
jgi:hypothetical protein